MMKTIRVSDKGQIAIPQSMREIMGINKGDELVLIEAGGKLLVEKAKKTEQKLQENFGEILKFSQRSLKSVLANKDNELRSIYLK